MLSSSGSWLSSSQDYDHKQSDDCPMEGWRREMRFRTGTCFGSKHSMNLWVSQGHPGLEKVA